MLTGPLPLLVVLASGLTLNSREGRGFGPGLLQWEGMKMKRKEKLLLVAILVSVGVVCGVLAGYEHTLGSATRPGHTQWVNKPTPASAWLRDRSHALWPARKIQVFNDTIRHYDYAEVATDTDHPISLGYWQIDSDGILFPHADLTADPASTNITMLGDWTDVEWVIDADGILWPKL